MLHAGVQCQQYVSVEGAMKMQDLKMQDQSLKTYFLATEAHSDSIEFICAIQKTYVCMYVNVST